MNFGQWMCGPGCNRRVLFSRRWLVYFPDSIRYTISISILTLNPWKEGAATLALSELINSVYPMGRILGANMEWTVSSRMLGWISTVHQPKLLNDMTPVSETAFLRPRSFEQTRCPTLMWKRSSLEEMKTLHSTNLIITNWLLPVSLRYFSKDFKKNQGTSSGIPLTWHWLLTENQGIS